MYRFVIHRGLGLLVFFMHAAATTDVDGESHDVLLEPVSESLIFQPTSTFALFIGTSCDLTGDGLCDCTDIDLITAELRDASTAPKLDLNSDGEVDFFDREFLIQGLMGSNYGDSNLDGTFDSADLTQVFQGGKFELDTEFALYCEGDWNGDGVFDSSDLILAFQHQNSTSGVLGVNNLSIYPSAASTSNSVVPEPNELLFFLLGAMHLWNRTRIVSIIRRR